MLSGDPPEPQTIDERAAEVEAQQARYPRLFIFWEVARWTLVGVMIWFGFTHEVPAAYWLVVGGTILIPEVHFTESRFDEDDL